ncbi:unnamed protein product, partial [Cladocopium goreaui]
AVAKCQANSESYCEEQIGPSMSSVAVVGGGMAGVAAARVLCQRGYHVRLYERSEELGGRLGNAQLGLGQVGLGATYVKAKDPIFKAEVAQLQEKGLVSEWNVGTPYFIESPGTFVAKPELKGGDAWYVGRPDMGSFVLLEDTKGLTRLCGKEVSSVCWKEASWLINGEDEVSSLILALPVAQIRALLAPGSLEELLPKETLDKDFEKGRVAAAFAFPESLMLPFCLAFVKDSPISLVLNDTSRTSGPDGEGPEVWVVQTTTEWAADCKKAETSENEMCRSLLAEFLRIVGKAAANVDHLKAIHWLYGDGDYQLPQGCVVDPRRRLCLCGDWCYNGRVEGAFLSGVKAATCLAELKAE